MYALRPIELCARHRLPAAELAAPRPTHTPLEAVSQFVLSRDFALAREQGGTAGAAYVFVRSGATWSQQAYIQASNPGAGDDFGNAVSISCDTLVVGARGEDSNALGINGDQSNNSATDSGAVYVFIRSGTAWSQQAYLKASNTEANDWFGFSVSVSGDVIAIGAASEDCNATGIDGNQASSGASTSGAAYLFTRTGASWTQLAYVKASNTDSGDWFGNAIAVSGGSVVVGAFFESSNATGVGGTQTNNLSNHSGAAYFYSLGFIPQVSAYGTGSPGCSGTHTLDATHAPFINSPQFGFTCDNAPPSTLGLGILTNAPDFAGSDPLFIGVILHVDLLGSTELYGLDFVSDALGMGAAPAPIPNVSALIGSTYYCMALWAWSSCSLPPYNLSTSRGLMFTVAAP